MNIMVFSKFEELEISKSCLSIIKGGTSTTLVTEIGCAENEYEDSNGNCELDSDDRFIGTIIFPCE